MTTRHESGRKKMNKLVMKTVRRWAAAYRVKHRGMDLDQLKESFKDAGYALYVVDRGSTIEVSLDQDGTEVRKGEVTIDFDYRKDEALYDGN